MKIGFIGLGIMGRPMALNLHNAKHSLIVPDRASLADDIRAVAEVVPDLQVGLPDHCQLGARVVRLVL